MICSKIYKIYMNVERCEMCRPDTHALVKDDQDSKCKAVNKMQTVI